MSYAQPYAGLRVVDLSQGLAAPYCAMLLAQHGAEVIKVEPPEGDWSRILGAIHDDQTSFSVSANLGKKSLALDLKSQAGAKVLWRLLSRADVLIEGFRPGVMQRLGFGYEAVAARVPRLLYASVSGFGQDGPLAQRPAMDPILQAYTGLAFENRDDAGTPRRVPVSIVDMAAALYAFQSLSAALYARRDEAAGCRLDLSLLKSATAFQCVRLAAAVLNGAETTVTMPPSGTFPTADGWIQLQVVKERDWIAYCEAMELTALQADPRFDAQARRLANKDALESFTLPRLASLTTAELERRFSRAGLMHQAVHTYEEFLAREAADECGAIAWLRHDGVAPAVPVPNLPGLPAFAQGAATAHAPHCGEHTRAVLADCGFTAPEIETLLQDGVAVARNRPASPA